VTTSRNWHVPGAVQRLRLALVMLLAPALVGLATGQVVAQTRRPPAGKGHAPAHPTTTRNFAPPPDGGAGPSGELVTTPSPALNSPGALADAGVVEARRLDGGTQVFKFKELDIEGRLKSPQLVYFLRRVRAEFAAGELGHRTFMREMSETRKE
jgi:hypothetical protein